MAKKKTVSLGIIGLGMIGTKHLQDFNGITDTQVLAIAEKQEHTLKQVGAEMRIPYTYHNYHDLLALNEIEAVVVCVPPYLQEEITLAALRAGKHVLCEKPVAVSSRSAQKITRAAKKAGTVFASCSSRFRFSPTVRKAREMIKGGELGDIYHVTLTGISRRYRPCIEYQTNSTWGLDKSKAGGGALMDGGMYDLDILFGLIPDLQVDRVEGYCFKGVDNKQPEGLPFNVEEHGMAALRGKNGILVFWERAWAAHMTSRPRIRIYGSEAGIAFDPLALTQDMFFEIYEDRSGKPVTIAPDMHYERWNIHRSVCSDFIDAIRKGNPPKTRGEEMAKYLKIIEAVYRSHAKNASVKLK
ncbi:hypothetical protein GF373_10145 [bacterium]|nr:hypothetical protein [bacterium]